MCIIFKTIIILAQDTTIIPWQKGDEILLEKNPLKLPKCKHPEAKYLPLMCLL